MNTLAHRSVAVKSIAHSLGFNFCGIAKAESLESERHKLETWLRRGYHGKMKYMENHFEKRLDPSKLVPGAKSVVCLMYNYFPTEDLSEKSELKISKYAYGEDYHRVIKDKLKIFAARIRETIGDVNARCFTDSAPVMERQWAALAGAGWIGKNSLLINRRQGSFFFLSEIIMDAELEYDSPIGDYCGTCTACIDACPTEAILEGGVVDASRCISYFTIELKDEIPRAMNGKFERWIFGCDICQDVCPWNRFSKPHREPRFNPSDEMQNLTASDWVEMTEETFHAVFKDSPLRRAGFERMKRNCEASNPPFR
ncbi:MAG: tRNA epoxyqueuosine(34) reductase QueG [Candidatus Nephrothrix sp. EaCA]|nr:MAG: tRNA epoxyqueuosine(34) reductase QueG [Candidatus Nephrothrix sp. EaCA]